MRASLKYLLPLLFALNVSAQTNFVQNGSFENYTTCPDNKGQLSRCVGWTEVMTSVDYFNNCADTLLCTQPQNYFGYAHPHSGNGYIGLCTGDVINDTNNVVIREWAKGQLTDTLREKIYYDVSFYVAKCDEYEYSTNNLGIYISDVSWGNGHTSTVNLDTVSIDYTSVLNINETVCDTAQWKKYTFTYRAKGGEKYIYLGNFYSDLNTAYTRCYTHTSNANAYDRYAYFFIDDIEIYRNDSLSTGLAENEIAEIKFFPNPTSNILTISTGNLQNAQVELFDISGRKLFQQNIAASQQIVDVSGYANGIYICTVTANGKVVKREKVVISR